jgi:hypothetical protein
MPEDHEGNSISVGYTGYLPFTVTGINTSTGALTVSTGYSDATVTLVPASDVHKGQPPTWPSLPS